jgi:hemolysin activation/secretion protein
VKTVRGYAANSASGAAAYSVRAAIATHIPLARIVAFSDVGWAGPHGQLLDEEPLLSVGLGISIFDGVLRLDFAQGLTRNGAFRISIATSGLL